MNGMACLIFSIAAYLCTFSAYAFERWSDLSELPEKVALATKSVTRLCVCDSDPYADCITITALGDRGDFITNRHAFDFFRRAHNYATINGSCSAGKRARAFDAKGYFVPVTFSIKHMHPLADTVESLKEIPFPRYESEDHDWDQIVLHIPEIENIPPLKLEVSDPQPGDEIFLIGFPRGETLQRPYQPLVSQGHVRQALPHIMEGDYFSKNGTSGGPVLNGQGRMVGLNFGMNPYPSDQLRHSYFIAKSHVEALIRAKPYENLPSSITTASPKEFRGAFFAQLPSSSADLKLTKSLMGTDAFTECEVSGDIQSEFSSNAFVLNENGSPLTYTLLGPKWPWTRSNDDDPAPVRYQLRVAVVIAAQGYDLTLALDQGIPGRGYVLPSFLPLPAAEWRTLSVVTIRVPKLKGFDSAVALKEAGLPELKFPNGKRLKFQCL